MVFEFLIEMSFNMEYVGLTPLIQKYSEKVNSGRRSYG